MNHDDLVQEATRDGKDPRSRKIIVLLSILAVLGFVTAGVAGWIAWGDKQKQVDAGKNLAIQIQQACKEPGVNTADIQQLCENAKQVEEITKAGPQCPPGLSGGSGPQGPSGEDGEDGPPGPAGDKGDQGDAGGAGEAGQSGSNCEPGATGPQGERGPQGEQGAQGERGEEGPAGQPAYPFTFTFTIPGDLTSPDRTFTITCSAPAEPCTTTANEQEG